MYAHKSIKLVYVCVCVCNEWFSFLLAGQSDGSGEDELSPIGGNGDRGGLPQFSDQRGRTDRSVQNDIEHPSSTTLWSNSSRYIYSNPLI